MKRPSTKIGAALAIALFSTFAVGCGGSKDGDGAGKGSLADKLVGYWVPDPKAMIEMAIADLPEGAKDDPATMKMMEEQMTSMAGKMVIHFDGAKTFMHGPGAPEESTYKIIATDEQTNTLTAEITDADGETETGKAIVDGDKLTLQKGDDEMKLELMRISEEEFKKRTATPATE